MWLYQSEFLHAARELVQRVFFRLGVEDPPLLGFAAKGWWESDDYKHPPIADFDPRMKWRPSKAKWPDAILAMANNASESKAALLWATRASEHTIDFHNVVWDELRAHDAISRTFSYISDGARVGSYDCVFVLECKKETVEARPHVVRALPKAKRPFTIGLFDSVIDSLLDRLANEARKGDSGLRGWSGIQERDVDDVLRDAGVRLLSNLQLAVWEDIRLSRNLFESINAIASLRYESSEPKAKIVFGKEGYGGPFEFKFRSEVSLSEAVWARKIIQLASGDFCIFSDTENLLGLVCRKTSGPGEFSVRLTGQSQWKLEIEGKPLAEVRFGLPSFPMIRLDRQQFESTFKRVFASHDEKGMEGIWMLVENVLAGNHGALLVMVEKADEEAERLKSQATPIEPIQLVGQAASRATAIDGAILLDPEGICHAIGVILDGAAHPLGTPSRGARFNSAVRYVGAKEGKGCLAIVVSEDGQVDLLPRLRPQVKSSEFFNFLEDILFYPHDKQLPTGFEEHCVNMMMHYAFYVRHYAPKLLRQSLPDLDDAGRNEFLMRAFMRLDIYRRPDRTPLPYDPHESDFIDDTSEGPEEKAQNDPPGHGDSSSEG